MNFGRIDQELFVLNYKIFALGIRSTYMWGRYMVFNMGFKIYLESLEISVHVLKEM